MASIEPGVVYEQGAWTALKEMFLATYNAWIYSRIIPKYFDEWYYIDPLCGPGLVRINETGDTIAGSPIIAAATAQQPFTKMYLADTNSRFRVAVKGRLDWLKTQGVSLDYAEPMGECNALLQDLGRRLPSSRSNFLAFIDLQGMEANWTSMQAILLKLGDVIVTFNTGQIQRTWGSAIAGEPAYETAMDRFYGSDIWRDAREADQLADLYLKGFALTDRSLTTRIRVHREDPPLKQEILFAARKTGGGSPWFDAVRDRIKPRVEANTDASVKQALDLITGRQPILDWFTQPDRDPQRSLRDFC